MEDEAIADEPVEDWERETVAVPELPLMEFIPDELPEFVFVVPPDMPPPEEAVEPPFKEPDRNLTNVNRSMVFNKSTFSLDILMF
jgi:hypothetical protein